MAAPRKSAELPTSEQTAFLERAVEQYGKAAYNFAFRLTRNEADARDLTQEAFIRVYRAWRSFKPGTSFLSWIYRIVTNLHRDELRRRKGRYLVEIPEDNEPRAFGTDRPLAEDPIERLRRGALQRARFPKRLTASPPSSGKSSCSPTSRSAVIKRLRRSWGVRSERCDRGCTARETSSANSSPGN